MKIRDFIPPVVANAARSLAQKSLASFAAAFARGDDSDTSSSATRLSQPYAQSGWVFAAVNLVSGEFTGLPVKIYKGDREVNDPVLAAWWAAPALGPDGKRLSRDQVDQQLAMWIQLEGEFFLLLDDSWVVTAGRAPAGYSPFIIARPDRVRLIVQSGKLSGYEYLDASGRRSVYLPEQVVHKMEPNPYDDWRGLGRQNVGRVATEAAFLTGTYIRDLMRNNGDQGSIVIGKSGVADDVQREQISAQLRAKRRALERGVARDIFLTGDIAVERPRQEAASVDLANTKTLSIEEIFVTFGVPPSMSGKKASYSIGKDSDRYQLITGTSQPLARKIAGTYGELAARQTAKPLTAEHDWDEHPVMQEVRNSRLDAALKLWATGMSWKDINEYLDLGMKEFAGWDVPYLPFSVSPALAEPATPTTPETDPLLAEPKAADLPEISTIKLLLATRARVQRQEKNVTPPVSAASAPPGLSAVESEVLKGFTCGCSADGGFVAQKSDRNPQEIARWREHMKARRESVKSFESAFGRVLFTARAETLRKIDSKYGKTFTEENKGNQGQKEQTDSSLSSLPPVQKAGATLELLFDLAKFATGFQSAMEKQQKAALNKAGAELLKELGKDDPFSMPPAEVTDFLASRENRLKDVPENIWQKIKASLQEGIDKGDSTADLTARVKAAFNGVSQENALRIAQTETAAAYGTGRDQAMRSAGVRYKAWLTSGNDNVREAHLVAGLTYSPDSGIPIDEPFIVDGEELMHPGDPNGSAKNVINCHCVQIAVKAPADS